MGHHVFGIRHHGPGSARSLRAELERLEPDCVLIEGPPEADALLHWLSHDELRPPVALLVYGVEEPRFASFYPFAVFSPEWQALRWAAERRVPARFIDLPATHQLAFERQPADPPVTVAPAPDDTPRADPIQLELRDDPIAQLAHAAGYADPELWWDAQVEQRTDSSGLFQALTEAMAALRAGSGAERPRDAAREAHMRVSLRKAAKEGFQRIAIVCGAWHAPALTELTSAKTDNELLKGLPKLKVACTWIPWTHSRLSFQSGYGAGVTSPGWFAHVWQRGPRAPVTWAIRAARLLRANDLDASSANVIETVRLAEALAALRDLPAPSLHELREAILSVLCGGDAVRLELIRDALEIGEELGAVPDGAVLVPVQRDFEREAKRLRVKITTESVVLELDLRKEHDRDRSRLFHRSRILGLDWAEPISAGRTSGTFRETFRLGWDPEFAVELVAANLYGNTVETAARGRLAERAGRADIPALAASIELALIADLPDAIPELLAALDARAAQSGDVRVLLAATAPLSRVLRYGDVRGTRVEALLPAFSGLFERALAGLLPACKHIDDDAAEALLRALEHAHAAVLLVSEAAAARADWLVALLELANAEAAHPRLRGRACRLLLEQQRLAPEELERQTSLALGSSVDPAHAARWLEGLLAGEGLFLVHHEALLGALDQWLGDLDGDVFQAELPVLRRAFSAFAPAERRSLARKLRKPTGQRRAERAPEAPDYDRERAERVLPVLATILGVEP